MRKEGEKGGKTDGAGTKDNWYSYKTESKMNAYCRYGRSVKKGNDGRKVVKECGYEI